jgi:hypothetical protein
MRAKDRCRKILSFHRIRSRKKNHLPAVMLRIHGKSDFPKKKEEIYDFHRKSNFPENREEIFDFHRKSNFFRNPISTFSERPAGA